MSTVLTPSLISREKLTISRIRELPLRGRVLVPVGSHVNAVAPILEAEIPGELIILRISDQIGITAEEVVAGMKVAVGHEVEQGAVLCEHSGLFGLFRSVFRSPDRGTIEFITAATGNVGLRLPSRTITVQAYLTGEVTSVDDGKSAQITAECGLVQGVFGVGGERIGILHLLATKADAKIQVSDIPSDASGLILVGGRCAGIEVLNAAADCGAVGLVTGSIDDETLKHYLGYDLGLALTGNEDVPMTVVITEGFGDLSISARALAVMEKFVGKPVSINGATQVRAGAIRPEIILDSHVVSTTDAGPEMKQAGGLVVGAPIRLIRVPYFGRRGEITELPIKSERIESGTTTRVLRARLENGDVVTVPRANVELL